MLAALSAGAQVAHVDGSKSAITWAKENAVVSGLAGKPVRWILDDAREFVKREIRREVRYDGIVMDPPVLAWPKERIMEDRRRFSRAHENLRGGSVKITGFLFN